MQRSASSQFKERQLLEKTVTTLQDMVSASEIKAARYESEVTCKVDSAVKMARKDASARRAKEKQVEMDKLRVASAEKKVSDLGASSMLKNK